MASPLRRNDYLVETSSLATGLYTIGAPAVPNVPRLPVLPSMLELPTDAYQVGDVVWYEARRGMLRTVLSNKSMSNTLLVTEQCENRCSFCSQPPNDLEDTHLYERAALAILNFKTDSFVGISGGEPTLNRSGFLKLIGILRSFENQTKLHILSNGRNFSDRSFSREVQSELGNREVLWGVPIYAHKSSLHDQLVGAQGAFCETVQGLFHLAEVGQSIELRIVPTRHNTQYLTEFSEFVCSALPFVSSVSIMNMEPKGWARRNFHELYTSVGEQARFIESAVENFLSRGIPVHLFNYPLCLLPETVRKFAVKSISDWKNYYPEPCSECRLRDDCGGFFTSAVDNYLEKIEVQYV